MRCVWGDVWVSGNLGDHVMCLCFFEHKWSFIVTFIFLFWREKARGEGDGLSFSMF